MDPATSLIFKARDNIPVIAKIGSLTNQLLTALRADNKAEASRLCRQILANTQNFDRDIRTIFAEVQQKLSLK